MPRRPPAVCAAYSPACAQKQHPKGQTGMAPRVLVDTHFRTEELDYEACFARHIRVLNCAPAFAALLRPIEFLLCFLCLIVAIRRGHRAAAVVRQTLAEALLQHLEA